MADGLHIGLLRLALHIPESGSLKSKRAVIKSLKDKARARFNVSVTEFGDLDKWQRIDLGVSMVSGERTHVESALQKIFELVASQGEVRVLDHAIEFL